MVLQRFKALNQSLRPVRIAALKLLNFKAYFPRRRHEALAIEIVYIFV